MESKDTRIYMIVDTQKITQETVENNVEFRDDRDNPSPSNDSKNFTSVINPRHKVFWFGQPKDRPQDAIDILNIESKSENELQFLEDKGSDPSQSGVYKAKVKEGFRNEEESKYNIIFQIRGKSGQFKVDPKLLMKI